MYHRYIGVLVASSRLHNTDDSSFKCLKGQSDVGANDCYIEYNSGIDLRVMKQRGINVATSNDPHSTSIVREVLMLLLLYFMMNIIVLLVLFYRVLGKKEEEERHFDKDDEKHVDKDENGVIEALPTYHNVGRDDMSADSNSQHS